MPGRELEIVPHPSVELVRESEVPGLLAQVRPSWQAKGLLARVHRLLPVDPSSACQRIFNAAVHDLREKVVIAGVDLAREAAKDHRLPPVERPEDVEGYPTAKLLDLCYRMGLLTRAEWRRLGRAYEIRRDLEHEDDEYEAGVEDCIYVFSTCIQAVLSKDPISLIRVGEIKELIEAASPAAPDAQLFEDYQHAPNPRQEEIMRFLVSNALDESAPDVVRQNAFVTLQMLSSLTRDAVRIALAAHVQEKVGRDTLTELQARVAHAAGALPYLRKAQRTNFFTAYYNRMVQVGHDWQSYPQHGQLLGVLQEVGGLQAVPEAVRTKILKWLVLAYMGEPGGYGTWGRNRRVFYSNTAAPLVEELLAESKELVRGDLGALAADKDVKRAMTNDYVARRFHDLLDLVGD